MSESKNSSVSTGRIPSLFLALISPWYDPVVGWNPVITADWRRLRRVLRRKRLSIVLFTLTVYIVFPAALALLVLFYSKSLFFGNYEFASFADIFRGYFAIAFISVFCLHYFVICFSNLLNPLGSFYSDECSSDPPVAPGFSRMFLSARLLPRLSLLPLFYVLCHAAFFTGGISLDFKRIPLILVYILIALSAVLAYSHVLWLSILLTAHSRTLPIRVFALLGLILIIIYFASPEEVLYTLNGVLPGREIPLNVYLPLWGLHPFGTIEAVVRFIKKGTSPFAHAMHPLFAVGIRLVCQIAVILAIRWLAIRSFNAVFLSLSGKRSRR